VPRSESTDARQPVGTGTIESAKAVTKALVDNGNIVSVGYMLRYLRCVQRMKQIIHENNLTVMATNARYVSDLSPTLTGLSVGAHKASPAPTRPSPSPLGGTRPSTWVPLSSRVPTSVTFPATLVVMSTSTRLCE
jgi:hypothetical protein